MPKTMEIDGEQVQYTVKTDENTITVKLTDCPYENTTYYFKTIKQESYAALIESMVKSLHILCKA